MFSNLLQIFPMYNYPNTLANNAISSSLLNEYKNEMRKELDQILSYWIHNSHDAVNGGFVGRIDENNIKHTDAPKGSVLNSRILWAFASAYKITQNPEHLYLARIAFNYLANNFIDKKNGGLFWTVTAKGQPMD